MSQDEFNAIIENIAKRVPNISVFEKNIIAIASYSTTLAKQLLELGGNDKFKVFMGQDPLNLNIVASDGSKYMYNDPVKEVEKQLIDFEKEYSRYPTLFIYGLGNGVLIKALLDYETHKTIAVFEPELEIMYIVLNMIDFSKDLFANRLIIANTEVFTPPHFYVLTKEHHVLNNARLYNLYINRPFYDTFKDDVNKINSLYAEAIIQHMRETGNDSTDALIGMNQTTKNAPYMIKGIPFSTIIKKRKKKVKTAIIVSTGPSLTKQIKLLKKVKDHATIISVDASYPILKKHGIKPDFVTSIERMDPTSKFFASKPSEFDNGIIFFVASLTHPDTVKYLQGRDYCLVMRPLGYERGFADKDYGYLGSGQSAANMAMDLALALGHEKIVLIGQDLAYAKDGDSHAKGHIYTSRSESDNKNRETTIAYGGDGEVETHMVWNLFRRYFENYAAVRKNKDKLRLINSTEGGARIHGFEEIPFKDEVALMLKEKKPVFARLEPFDAQKQQAKLEKFSKHLNAVMRYGKTLQGKAERLFKELAKQIEKTNKLRAKGEWEKIDFTKLQNLAFKIDAFKESLNDKRFLQSYYTIATPMITNQELEFAPVLARPSDTLREKQEKLIEWVSLQGHWLFSIAGFIDVTNENLSKNSKDWLITKK